MSLGCSLEGLMLKLKLQYFGHLIRRADSLEKTLMLGKTEGRRRRGRQRMRWLDGITDSMDLGLGELWGWWWTGRPGVLQFMGSQRVGHDWATELNWAEYSIVYMYHILSIHLSMDIFHALVIVNSAAVNIRVRASFWIMFFSGYVPRSETAGSNGGFIPRFFEKEISILFSICISLHSHQQEGM